MLAVVDYGASNLMSVRMAFEEVGEEPAIVQHPDDLRRADRIVLPGVGAMPHAMELLRQVGMGEALNDAVVRRGVPYLGICLGMQMMVGRSWEFDLRTDTFGWLSGETTPMQADPPRCLVPHMGWATLREEGEHPVLAELRGNTAFYFCHSLAVTNCAEVLATVEHSAPTAAVAGRDNMVGVQFHPERSGRNGLRLLEKFLSWNP